MRGMQNPKLCPWPHDTYAAVCTSRSKGVGTCSGHGCGASTRVAKRLLRRSCALGACKLSVTAFVLTTLATMCSTKLLSTSSAAPVTSNPTCLQFLGIFSPSHNKGLREGLCTCRHYTMWSNAIGKHCAHCQQPFPSKRLPSPCARTYRLRLRDTNIRDVGHVECGSTLDHPMYVCLKKEMSFSTSLLTLHMLLSYYLGCHFSHNPKHSCDCDIKKNFSS